MTSRNPGHGKPVRILMYHHVGQFKDVDSQYGVYCDVDRFARQMALLKRSLASVISMDRALQALTGQAPLKKPGIVLTFDDGFSDFYDYAWPVLKKFCFPALVYAISERLGATQDWHDMPAHGSGRLMDARTLRHLADEGLDIGGHTATHPHLHRLPRDQRNHEIVEAKYSLEDKLGREVRHFAYPFGDYDADVRDRVADAGFHTAVTTHRGLADASCNLFEVPRIDITYKDVGYRYWRKARWRKFRRRGKAQSVNR